MEFIVSASVCVHANWKRLKQVLRFLISNFRRALNVVLFLLGDSPALCADVSEHCQLHLHYTSNEDGTRCSETSAHKIQTPEESPKRKNKTIIDIFITHSLHCFFGGSGVKK